MNTLLRKFGSYPELLKSIGITPRKSNPKAETILLKCTGCGVEFLRKKRVYNSRKKDRVFHSKRCCNEFYKNLKKKMWPSCIRCGSQFPPDSHCKVFCNPQCGKDFRYKKFIEDWKSGLIKGSSGDSVSKSIRRYLFEKFDSKCSRCGWCEVNKTTGLIPLTIEHMDGNPENHSESNLDLICPNCHSLTSTYGGLNRGNGRKSRYKIKSLSSQVVKSVDSAAAPDLSSHVP